MTTTPAKNESLPELVAAAVYDWMANIKPNGDFLPADVVCDYAGMCNFKRDLAAVVQAALTREAPPEASIPCGNCDGIGRFVEPTIGEITCKACDGRGAFRLSSRPAAPPAPQRHPDALEDGSLSKSTAKRVDALRMAQGDGMVLVPRELTISMREAAEQEEACGNDFADMWEAAIATYIFDLENGNA